MRTTQKLFASTGVIVVIAAITGILVGSTGRAEDRKPEDSRIEIGFAVAPDPRN